MTIHSHNTGTASLDDCNVSLTVYIQVLACPDEWAGPWWSEQHFRNRVLSIESQLFEAMLPAT